ncbi:MAG: gliding motility protein GldM [Bacteroidales bacterium]|nr:gliding motility protein GldM [Bacteroidales bacterium]
MAGGNCPETPRQKMIGMMYLFYTALLALNVSGEIVEAFVKIDDSIKKTTVNFSAKTQSLYAKIDAKVAEQPGKYSALAKQAHDIESMSNKLFVEIDRIKLLIIQESQGKEATLDDPIKKKDDLHAAVIVMVGQGGPMLGDSLRKSLEDFRDVLFTIVDDTSSTVYKSIAKTIELKDSDNPEEPWSWQETLCRGMPMIGTLALLSKVQADVRNAEADVLEFMIAKLEGLDIRITSLEGLVSAPISFVVRGGQYTSSVFLGARDTTMRPTVYLTYDAPFFDSTVVNGEVQYRLRQGVQYDTLPLDASGKGQYVSACGGVGDFTYGGLVHYKSNRGDMWLPYKANYVVGDAGFTVSASKCNVFYRGLENPVEVAVSGYPKESVSVSISGGALIRATGKGYIVTVPQGVAAKQVNITVSVRTPEGGRTLGSAPFNILNVPPPTILVAGAYKDGAELPKAALTRNPYLSAKLESDFFPFEGVAYSVAKYDFFYTVRGVTNKVTVDGSQFSSGVLAEITKMGTGSQVSFSNIFYNGPSGTRQTNGVTVILK